MENIDEVIYKISDNLIMKYHNAVRECIMEIKLLTNSYKNDEHFYQAFLDDTLWQSEYLSNESILIPRQTPVLSGLSQPEPQRRRLF